MAAGKTGKEKAGKAVKKKGKTAAADRKPRQRTPSTEFWVHAPGAREIFLAGDFNDWEDSSVKYRLRKYKGDIWKKKVVLKPGRYEYQFVVDGSWWIDPENLERAANPYGTENSVITVFPSL